MQSSILKPYKNSDEIFAQATLKSQKYNSDQEIKRLADAFQKEFIDHVSDRHRAAIAGSAVFYDSYIYMFSELIDGEYQCRSVTLGDQTYRDVYAINKNFRDLVEVTALLQFIFDNASETICLLLSMLYKDHKPVIRSSAHIERIVFPDDDPSDQSFIKIVYHIEYKANQ